MGCISSSNAAAQLWRWYLVIFGCLLVQVSIDSAASTFENTVHYFTIHLEGPDLSCNLCWLWPQIGILFPKQLDFFVSTPL
jgi:hypothetical protein